MAEPIERTHSHHAEAKALHGDFLLPLKHTIEPQALVTLEAKGGYLAQEALPFRSEGIVSYRAAHTQVAGNKDVKPGHGWSTVSTAVVEGLNILEVITADRVVSQIFAEYPLEGYVPAISFLGTRFENLRIAGKPIDIDLNIDLFGPKPADDLHYTAHEPFMSQAQRQAATLSSFNTLPAGARERYERYNQGKVTDGFSEIVECSLVNQIEGAFPGKTFGHVIHIPHFGTVYFATVKVTHEDFHHRVPHKTTVELTMIDAKLGCIGHGTVSGPTTKTNGGSAGP